MISHILRHENELIYKIIEEKIYRKKDRGYQRTAYIEQIIFDTKPSRIGI
jgi:hypothetical protein